jgi:hypothetical protein
MEEDCEMGHFLYRHRNKCEQMQDGDGDRDADLMSSWTRDPAEKLETHLAEVKHQGYPKIWHSKPLDNGRLPHAMI